VVIPRRIECCDISHLGGTDTVGAVVALLFLPARAPEAAEEGVDPDVMTLAKALWAAGAEALVEARDLDQCVGAPPP
jgi:hypothetical protein